MRVAEVLSDLTSLRVCVMLPPRRLYPASSRLTSQQEPAAAQALVSARPSLPASSVEAVKAKTAALRKQSATEGDADLQRAKDLIDLHYKVKVTHANGTVDEGLESARRDVGEVLRGLDG
jgi:hypothetical protein